MLPSTFTDTCPLSGSSGHPWKDSLPVVMCGSRAPGNVLGLLGCVSQVLGSLGCAGFSGVHAPSAVPSRVQMAGPRSLSQLQLPCAALSGLDSTSRTKVTTLGPSVKCRPYLGQSASQMLTQQATCLRMLMRKRQLSPHPARTPHPWPSRITKPVPTWSPPWAGALNPHMVPLSLCSLLRTRLLSLHCQALWHSKAQDGSWAEGCPTDPKAEVTPKPVRSHWSV